MKTIFAAWLASLGVLVGASAADVQPPTLPLGASAPDFSLPGVDGRTWTLKDFAAAKVLVVLFTCNNSPTAQYYEERVMQLVKDYRDRGVAHALNLSSPFEPKLDIFLFLDDVSYRRR